MQLKERARGARGDDDDDTTAEASAAVSPMEVRWKNIRV